MALMGAFLRQGIDLVSRSKGSRPAHAWHWGLLLHASQPKHSFSAQAEQQESQQDEPRIPVEIHVPVASMSFCVEQPVVHAGIEIWDQSNISITHCQAWCELDRGACGM
jgi:hypothetical protein